jgi:hypothetical protein
MRVFAVLAALAAVFASVTVAASAKGKPPKTGPGCKPAVSVILKGTVAGATAALPSDLMINVKHSNKHGRAYVQATQPVTVHLTTDTKIRRNNTKGLDALQAIAAAAVPDRVLVQARVCKADLANGATPDLTAKRVVAHPSKS